MISTSLVTLGSTAFLYVATLYQGNASSGISHQLADNTPDGMEYSYIERETSQMES